MGNRYEGHNIPFSFYSVKITNSQVLVHGVMTFHQRENKARGGFEHLQI